MQQTKSGEKRFFLCIVLSAWSSTTSYKCPSIEVFSGHMNHHFPIAVFDAAYFKVRNWITITLTMHQCIHYQNVKPDYISINFIPVFFFWERSRVQDTQEGSK